MFFEVKNDISQQVLVLKKIQELKELPEMQDEENTSELVKGCGYVYKTQEGKEKKHEVRKVRTNSFSIIVNPFKGWTFFCLPSVPMIFLRCFTIFLRCSITFSC